MSSKDSRSAERLPIKLILPNQGTSKKVPGGGGKLQPFRPVDDSFRSSLRAQVMAVNQTLAPQLRRVEAAPIRVQLIEKAYAKSHRPTQLFSENTCPIIGVGKLGELFVKATLPGLAALQDIISQNTTNRITKDLSTVRSIEAITPLQRRKRKSALEVLQKSPRIETDRFLIRVRLFDLNISKEESHFFADFTDTCALRELIFSQVGYGSHSHVYSVACRNEEDIEILSRLVSVRSIIGMPLLRTVRPNAFNETSIQADLPDSSQVDGDFPSVVVVDSGVQSDNQIMESWVIDRQSTVARAYRNPSHGTFVAGLIIWGDRLNPHLPDINNQPCSVVDLQVIPNWDPSRGNTESITEQEFLQTLEEALKRYANQHKVWNLSLSTDEVCAEDEFSAMAEQLDNLQEQYQVSFVISAGNYETLPLLDFPRSGDQITHGRITTPADSVLAITVGSISHRDYLFDGPKREEPSPFSRHGAGPNYIIKPDLVHYGGTCTTDTQHIAGVRSVTEAGCGEDIGTSFSTPLVSRSLAQIYHHITPSPSPVLARALLTHHARDPRTGGRVRDGDENFLGFGRPAPPPYCLQCGPHQSTLVFEDSLRLGFFLEWDDFPYPPSLRQGDRFLGEVWMTIAFTPSRGARWGTEYCETHIDAKFGVYRSVRNRATGIEKLKFSGMVPPEHSNPGSLYEHVQVKELRKWAPVRTYYRNLGGGERGERWRLKVQMLTRHGIERTEAAQSQPFALMLTIADPDKTAPIYDEMAQLIRNRYQSENLRLRSSARIRTQT